MSETISFECCEYPMKVCDGTSSDLEVSNNNRVSVNIWQGHQKDFANYYSNELDLPYNVLKINHDITIPTYYIRNIKHNILIYSV